MWWDKHYRREHNKIIILPQPTLRCKSGTYTHSDKTSGNRYIHDGQNKQSPATAMEARNLSWIDVS